MADRARLNESRILIVNLDVQGGSVLPHAWESLLFPQKRLKHFDHICNKAFTIQYSNKLLLTVFFLFNDPHN